MSQFANQLDHLLPQPGVSRIVIVRRMPRSETVSQGVPLAILQDLVRYWSTDYDW